MKVVINIPDHIYHTLVETGKYGYYKFDAKKAIKNGTPLPKEDKNCPEPEEMEKSCRNCKHVGEWYTGCTCEKCFNFSRWEEN